MNELFINLYLDEDVDHLVAKLVRPNGFNVIITSEIGRRGESDSLQLEYAVENNLTILTHNRVDFERLAQEYFFDGKTHYGIIISVQRPPHEIAEKLLNILNDFTMDETMNQIIYI